MSPRPGVLWSVLAVTLLGAAMADGLARAQSYDEARRTLGLAPDPIARSPRLLGLGRLSLVVPDPHNRITLWDFAGTPAGLLDNDSVSTLAVRPGSATASSVHDFSDMLGSGERQDLAAREARLGYETWRRSRSGSLFGVSGDVGTLRFDRPFSQDFERRSQFTEPNIMVVLGGKMPYFNSGRTHYALRILYGAEHANDEFRRIVSNAAGQYIDRTGVQGPTPDVFTPDVTDVQTQGAGVSASYRLGGWATAALGVDALRERIKSTNDRERYESERRESRPFNVGQASLVGRVGPHFEWGADGRGWMSSSTETWAFTISTNTGGAGAAPFVGRGDYQSREEEGSTLRTRARWFAGALELGASLGTAYRKVTLTPPPVTDRNSFNNFLNSVFYRTRADTTIYPDSAIFNETQDHAWDAAGGVSWRLPGRRGVIGAEYHRWRDILSQTVAGVGPRRVGWDVRGGLEMRCNAVLTGRLGYSYRRDDLDEFVRQNETVTSSATLGFGLAPEGAHWQFESGYAFDWSQADYGTPARPRGTRQQLATQVEWRF
jgi:hypothetical protein